FHDSAGNEYHPLASNGGYRLTCSRLPKNLPIKMVFAVLSLGKLREGITMPKGGFSVSEWGGIKNVFDMLDSRPSPSTVIVKGEYRNKVKSFSVASTLNVKDGD